MPVISLALLFALYTAGLVRVWRHAGVGAGVAAWEATAFAGGFLALLIALSPPLDDLSDHWLVAHMAQHELLMAVAASLGGYFGARTAQRVGRVFIRRAIVAIGLAITVLMLWRMR